MYTIMLLSPVMVAVFMSFPTAVALTAGAPLVQAINPVTWVYALGQAFFSLSLAGNGTLIYGSYLRDDENVIGSAWKVALFDTLAAMLAALVIN